MTTYSEVKQLVANKLGEDASSPKAWTSDEFLYGVNSGMKRISEFYSGWIKDGQVTVLSATTLLTSFSDLVEIASASISSSPITKVDILTIPLDGVSGEPLYYAVTTASSTTPSSAGLVVYPEPDTGYTMDIRYSYVPVITDPMTTMPIPDRLITALVLLACAEMSTKRSVSDGGDYTMYNSFAMTELGVKQQPPQQPQQQTQQGV